MTRPTRAQPALPGIGRGGRVARVRRAVDAQLTAQRATGQLEPVDAGLIALARTVADELDYEHTSPDGSAFTVATLAGRLAPILLELRGDRLDRGSDVGYDEELARLVAALRDTPRP